MNDWVEIFETGNYPQGNYSELDIDKMISNFERDKSAGVPITLDHQKQGQAYGWVDSLKREGKKLLAKFKDVVPELVEAVKSKRYKNRSVGLKDDRLVEVTFLGAKLPQVKSLAEIKFSENCSYIDFNEVTDLQIEVDDLKKEVDDLKKQLQAVLNKDQGEDDSENTVSNNVPSGKSDKRFAELDFYKQKEVVEFCEGLVKQGKIFPRILEQVKALASTLQENRNFVEFNEMGTVKKETPLGLFKHIMNDMQGHGLFSEIIKEPPPEPAIYNFSDPGSKDSDMKMAKVEKIAKERGLKSDDMAGRYAIINELASNKAL